MSSKNIGKIKRIKRCDLIKSLADDLSSKEMLNLFVEILPEVERKVLRLHFWEGMNFKSIAKKLDLKTSTIAHTYRKALRRLRQKKRLILSNYIGEI